MTWNRSPADGGGGGSSSAGTTPAVAVTVDHGDDTGLARLRELGYKQELKRDLSYVLPLVTSAIDRLLYLFRRSFVPSTSTSATDRLSVCVRQGAVQLRLLLLHHLGADGDHDALQHGAQLRRAGHHDVRLVRRRRLHHGRRHIHGRDLLLLPHLRRTLLLERAPLRQTLGALRLLDHRMVQCCWTVGGDHQRGLLPSAADPGDHPAGHRRQERRWLRGVQVHGDRVPRRHPAQPRRHQQPPHHLPLLLRPVRRRLEHAGCVCPDDRRADRRHREGERRVRVHPLQHRQRRRDSQQFLHLRPGPAHEPVHAHRIRRLRAHDRGDQERRQERADRHHQRHRHLHPGGLGLHPRHHLRSQGHPLPAEPRQRLRWLRHRRGLLPCLQEPIRQRRRRDRLPRDCRRRRLLLRHELRDQQLQDGIRLLQGRRHAILRGLAQGQQAGSAHQRRLALGSRRALHGAAVPGQPGGVPGDGVHRDDRAVHLVRAADPVPGDAGAQALRAGALQPGPLRRPRRLGRRALGRHHHRALLAAGHVPRHQGHAQLHARRRRRPLLPRPRVLAAPRQALVQGTRHQSQSGRMMNWIIFLDNLVDG